MKNVIFAVFVFICTSSICYSKNVDPPEWIAAIFQPVEEGKTIGGKNKPFIGLVWKAVDEADTYRILRRNGNESPFKEIILTNDTKYADYNIAAYHEYTYSIQALSNNHESVLSVEKMVRTEGLFRRKPKPPDWNTYNVETSKTNEEVYLVNLSWKPVSGAISYNVLRVDRTGKYISSAGTTNTTSYTDVIRKDAEKKQYYRITTLDNSYMESQLSATIVVDLPDK